MIEADLPVLEPAQFNDVLGDGHWAEFAGDLRAGADLMAGRTLWHVNSAMTGGGVAELLKSVLGYLLGAKITSRWMVLEGDDDFFIVTKRIHHMLHGKEGDGGPLGHAERNVYEDVLEREFATLGAQVHQNDVVVLHDPQVVGLAPFLRDLGVSVIWNCHVGADAPNERSRQAWRFLLPAAKGANAQVFSRSQYRWEGLDPERVVVIPPCIDAFSPKNQPMASEQVAAILAATGILATAVPDEPRFVRQSGVAGFVTSATQMIESSPIPPDAPVVTQVSRWDPLKDHSGLALAFAEAFPEEIDAHLVLAGPAPEAVADDPEGAATLEELRTCVDSLPADARSRLHIACLPMDDIEENAAVVNALQRRSQVVVQKSLAEGFGLTVAEAMWKERALVASAVGGIRDQVTSGVDGILVDDPEDTSSFGLAITSLLHDPPCAVRLGRAARASVTKNYLAPSYLSRYLSLVERVLQG